LTALGPFFDNRAMPTHLVLVADDEPSMLELVARHLKSHDNPKLEILEASDGEQAWRLAQERLPDLVVLDVMMPGMSGWEVCRKIREDVALAHTGVVMLTGIGENLNQMTSPLYGADAYIDKPFEFAELDAKVAIALRARATLRGSISRPPSNGVAGPAKLAKGATRAPVTPTPKAKTVAKLAPIAKKAAKAVKKVAKGVKKAAVKAVAKRLVPKKATTKRAAAPAGKKKAPIAKKKAATPKRKLATVKKKAATKKSKPAKGAKKRR
jgi:DNA-binding response OmpR family regulator